MYPFVRATGAQSAGYQISRSLRLRASSPGLLSRTPGVAGNRTTFTLSFWMKRGALGTARVFGVFGGTTDSDFFTLSMSSDSLGVGGGVTSWRVTNAVLRDPSAWYHVVVAVDTTQATANNRIRVYINGVEQTYSTLTNPAQNATLAVNTAAAHSFNSASTTNDCYLADAFLIDGQQLDHTSFGQTDATTGVWSPKAYTGTYGTNGFHLDFSDNSAATAAAIGADRSGNGNNWTPSGISVTAGTTNDSLVDSPTNYGTDTGLGGEVRGNYCTFNYNDRDTQGVLYDGNLRTDTVYSPNNDAAVRGTMGVSSGKWGFEVTNYAAAGSNNTWIAGFTSNTAALAANNAYLATAPMIGFQANFPTGTGVIGKLSDTSSQTNITGSTWNSGDTLQVLVDFDAGNYWIGRGGQYWNSSNTLVAYNSSTPTGTFSPTGSVYYPVAIVLASSDNVNRSGVSVNFGQRAFSNALPSGFKVLCTQNLPTPAIIKPNLYFDATLYTGNGTSQTIVNAGGFQPDLVWMKSRSGVAGHAVVDSIRGVTKVLETDALAAELTSSAGNDFTAFNSNGFSVGAFQNWNSINGNGVSEVAWQWKKGATPGFDIVAVASASAAAVSHSLGVKPEMIITKNRASSSTNWYTTHKSLQANMQDSTVNLANTSANSASAGVWGGEPTTTTFFAGNNIVTTGQSYIAYLFASVAGFSKFGSYTGNGSTDGPFVYCGFRPKFILVKEFSGTNAATSGWVMVDTARDTINVAGALIQANSSGAESSSTIFDILCNGFKPRTANQNWNESSGSYLFAAFAETPFKYSRAR